MKLATIGFAAVLAMSSSFALAQNSTVTGPGGTAPPATGTAESGGVLNPPPSNADNSTMTTGTGTGAMNSSQADYDASRKDGSAPSSNMDKPPLTPDAGGSNQGK